MSKVFSLSDLKGRDGDEDDGVDEKDKLARQTYYAGGTKSGVAIVGPNKRSNETPSDDFFKSARQAEKENKIVPKEGETVMNVLVVFYADCLTYKVEENEEIRLPYSDEDGKEFCEALSNDKLPKVMRAIRAKDGSVPLFDFKVVDKRKEPFHRPEPKVEKPATFTGVAHSTGSNEGTGMMFGACGLEPVVTDSSKPCTNIQIRLPNGRRVVGKFNQTEHTIAHLRRFIDTNPQSVPIVTGHTYEIVAALPPRPLTDTTQTLQDAKLCNAAVNIRLC